MMRCGNVRPHSNTGVSLDDQFGTLIVYIPGHHLYPAIAINHDLVPQTDPSQTIKAKRR
jgi:hypothetical protein